MINDADKSPDQELNYLRKFTSGNAQQLVDNYRKRLRNDSDSLLQSLWEELERRFGSPAVITNALMSLLISMAALNG